MDREQVEGPPGEHDVICGRGPTPFNHKGNSYYRQLIHEGKAEHGTRSLADKAKTAADIIEKIGESGGRFLKQDPDGGAWNDIGYEAASEKVKQALREQSKTHKEKNTAKVDRSSKSTNVGPTFVPPVFSLARAATLRRGTSGGSAASAALDTILVQPLHGRDADIAVTYLNNLAEAPAKQQSVPQSQPPQEVYPHGTHQRDISPSTNDLFEAFGGKRSSGMAEMLPRHAEASTEFEAPPAVPPRRQDSFMYHTGMSINSLGSLKSVDGTQITEQNEPSEQMLLNKQEDSSKRVLERDTSQLSDFSAMTGLSLSHSLSVASAKPADRPLLDTKKNSLKRVFERDASQLSEFSAMTGLS
jgi:hypothetical protein